MAAVLSRYSDSRSNAASPFSLEKQWIQDTTARIQQHDCSGFSPDSLSAIRKHVRWNLKPVIIVKQYSIQHFNYTGKNWKKQLFWTVLSGFF